MTDSDDKFPPENNRKKAKMPPQKIAVEIPSGLEAVYANIAFITHTPAEIIIDLAQFLPRTKKGKVVSRVIMSPMHAKALHNALGQNIANFERQFGKIQFPRSLADELFNFRPPEAPDDKE